MTAIAAIAPLQYLHTISSQEFFLANVDEPDPDYLQFFQDQSDLGKFVIVESKNNATMNQLAQVAESMGASEIAIPSVPDNRVETVAIATEYLGLVPVVRKTKRIIHGLRPSFMLVPQGKDGFDWLRCANNLIAAYLTSRTANPSLFSKNLTLGLSYRLYISLIDPEPELVISSLQHFRRTYKTETHLIGWDAEPDIIEQFPFRSVSFDVPFKSLYGNAVWEAWKRCEFILKEAVKIRESRSIEHHSKNKS